MAARAQSRLPGVRFEAQAPPPAEVLPRMDVAAFVGFAASGPLHVPVAMEDPARLADVFGGDLVLAWDAARGEPVRAHLVPAARAFFRNGGTRCFVVRVAGKGARSNHFQVPGLVRLAARELTPARAAARSEGSWSDALAVGAAVASTPLTVLDFHSGDAGSPPSSSPALQVALDAPDALAAGDLVRLRFGDGGPELQFAVRGVATDGWVDVDPAALLWLARTPPAPPGSSPTALRFGDGIPASLDARGPVAFDSATGEASIPVGAAALPEVGELVQVLDGAAELWLRVTDVQVPPPGSGAAPAVLVGAPAWRLGAAPALPDALPTAERLQLELTVRDGDAAAPRRLGGLGLAPAHPRFWAALPTDAALFEAALRASQLGVDGRPGTPYPDLWDLAASPRWPLAGDDRATEGVVRPGAPPEAPPDGHVFFPVAIDLVPGDLVGATGRSGLPIDRDGLATFDASLFLDDDLRRSRLSTLAADADFLRWQSPNARSLRGLHAVLEVDEVTVVAVPDAVHDGWDPEGLEAAPEPPPPEPPPVVARSLFSDCARDALPEPALAAGAPDAAGILELRWTAPGAAGATFALEEATDRSFETASLLARTPDASLVVFGRAPGAWYYRVRAEGAAGVGPWSNGVLVAVPSPRRVLAAAAPDRRVLLEVHRALLRACAARGDLLAVLALHRSDREADAIAHAVSLCGGADGPSPLEAGELAALTYGALFHPWLAARDEAEPGAPRWSPPDGAVTGMVARRAIARGAWVAPANEPLRGVVALAPEVPAAAREKLAAAAVNLLRQEPDGFLALAADTLSTDPDLVPIGVRRLLVLLRRAALELGAAGVFEPNGPSFRRRVERGLEALLDGLWRRGALAGDAPDEAFQVVADEVLNPPSAVDLGRLVVELKVAPSLPLEFLTLRLVRSDDRAQVTEVR